MTERDYSDLVNPYVRAEAEAERRGFWHGVASAIWAILIACIIAGALYAGKVGAAEWTFEEARKPIRASERGAQISVCHNNAVTRVWRCFFVMEPK